MYNYTNRGRLFISRSRFSVHFFLSRNHVRNVCKSAVAIYSRYIYYVGIDTNILCI